MTICFSEDILMILKLVLFNINKTNDNILYICVCVWACVGVGECVRMCCKYIHACLRCYRRHNYMKYVFEMLPRHYIEVHPDKTEVEKNVLNIQDEPKVLNWYEVVRRENFLTTNEKNFSTTEGFVVYFAKNWILPLTSKLLLKKFALKLSLLNRLN